MAPLTDQLLALRIPLKLRHGSPEELDAHITNNIIGTLRYISSSKLAQCDIDALDPFQDTLAYLYVLNVRISTVSGKSKSAPPQLIPGGELWQKTARFVNVFDPLQMRYAEVAWRYLVDSMVSMGVLGKSNQTSATALLAAAMIRLDSSCGTLTDTHLQLIRLALETQTYHDALPVLHRDIYSFPLKNSTPDLFPCSDHHLSNGYITLDSRLTAKIDRNDVLEYFLLGGMVYIGAKNWSRAQYFLEHVLSTPTNGSATGMMLDAYQKWLLVGLMRSGKAPSVPKVANTGAIKALRSLSRHYQAVVDAFLLEERKKLQAEVWEGRNIFIEDGNYGLVQEVVDHHQKLSVSKLGRLYAAVPVERIAREYNSTPSETEDYLQSLVAEGHLRATIEKAAGGSQALLRFSQDQHHTIKSEVQSREELIRQTRRIEELTAHVADADRRLGLSEEYLEHVRVKQRREENGEGNEEMGGIPFGGRPPSEGDEDESMMTDIP